MSVRSGSPAPYAPPAAILTVINGYRDRGLTTPFDADVLVKAGVLESLVPRTLKSLEVLELIDKEGKPTAQMEGLRRATSDEFRLRLAEVVKGAYAEVLAFADPAKDDMARITDAFRGYEPVGQRDRMVTLFLGLCTASGIVPEGKKPAVGAGRAATPRPPAKRRTEEGRPSHRPSFGASAPMRGDGGIIPPALTGLLAAIPLHGRGWTKAKRESFMTTFGAVLDFTVPIREVEPDQPDDQEGDE